MNDYLFQLMTKKYNLFSKMSGGKIYAADILVFIITNLIMDFIYFLFSVVKLPLTNICCNSETCLPTNK